MEPLPIIGEAKRLAQLTLDDHERQHGPLSTYSGCRCDRCAISRKIVGPKDPSPTPWDSDTWGFYCDHCMAFFDLVEDGTVYTWESGSDFLCEHRHKACGQAARYIGYDRDAVAKCELCGQPMPRGEEMFRYHGFSGDCPTRPLPEPK